MSIFAFFNNVSIISVYPSPLNLYSHLLSVVNGCRVGQKRVKRAITGNWGDRVEDVCTVVAAVVDSLGHRLINPCLCSVELAGGLALIPGIERVKHSDQMLASGRPLHRNSRPGSHVWSETLHSHAWKDVWERSEECEAVAQRPGAILIAFTMLRRSVAGGSESRYVLVKLGCIDYGVAVWPVLVEVGECEDCVMDASAAAREFL